MLSGECTPRVTEYDDLTIRLSYFCETGIGTARDEREAILWFKRAAQHGDKRAFTRLRTLGIYSEGDPSMPSTPALSAAPRSPMSPTTPGGFSNGRPSAHASPHDAPMPRKGSAAVNGSGPVSALHGKHPRRRSDADCIIM